MNKMDLYNRSPILLQNLMTTAQGTIYRRERFGEIYRKALNEFADRDYTDLDALKRYQTERAKELVSYAVAHSSFYREFYKDADLDAFYRIGDITLLPVLEKETVRRHITEMYTIPEQGAIVSNTSGTTGKSMRFLWTLEDNQRRMAYLDAFKLQHGFVHLKMKRASFNSSKIVPPGQKKNVFWRDNLAVRQRIYSGYHCKGNHVQYYVENLNQYKPDALDGYPSAIYEVAKYIVQHQVKLTFTPKAIFPTAETLLPHYKKMMEEAFGCPVRDQYASSEGAPYITECTCGKLHVGMDTGIIEFMEDGRMLMTSFDTHGTPLIRYDIGDKAYLAEDQTCACGNKMPVVERIDGRSLDFIESPYTGRFTSVYMSLVSADFVNSMRAMQFVQNEPDAVDVYLETDENYRPEMNKIIEDKLHYSLGEKMIIRIHVVDRIEKDPSGKFRLIINNVSK